MPSFDGMNGESALAGSARRQLTASSGAFDGSRHDDLAVCVSESQLRSPERVSEWQSWQRCCAPSTLAPSSCRLFFACVCSGVSQRPPQVELSVEDCVAHADAKSTNTRELRIEKASVWRAPLSRFRACG